MKIYIKRYTGEKSKYEKFKGNTTRKKIIWNVTKNKNPNAMSEIRAIFSLLTLYNYLSIMPLLK